ncbi:DUF4437 domain-containing protein [Sphingomonas prati]|uniref:DUF4437 domain-containing protein n=1 Tax=Sphingomonas prati TaxID=1843237 RepID=A0A7W9BSC8_9SPHN|nr:DUF4437 domain-containing protein [Sphingomonas prati]MBB5729039.1 hypothetical protein [Sphingomonas prati]GGE85557.1 hypothetical protein GCM10011404_17930 [Sphingomonas prati]
MRSIVRGLTVSIVPAVALMALTPANSDTSRASAAPQAQLPSTTLPVTPNGMIVAPAETLVRFRPLIASSPNGPNILELEGDSRRGPSVTLFRYTNGYTGSRTLHTHSHTYRSILIEGQMKHWDASGNEATAPVLDPGSYWRQPRGQLHADHCLSHRCVALVTFEGAIDADFPGPH